MIEIELCYRMMPRYFCLSINTLNTRINKLNILPGHFRERVDVPDPDRNFFAETCNIWLINADKIFTDKQNLQIAATCFSELKPSCYPLP